jgi:hypothetical protein
VGLSDFEVSGAPLLAVFGRGEESAALPDECELVKLGAAILHRFYAPLRASFGDADELAKGTNAIRIEILARNPFCFPDIAVFL